MRVLSPLSVLLFSAVLLSFQDPTKDTTKPASVAGRIIDSKLDEPVKRALVILRRGNERGIGAYTDATGKFAFQAIEPGAYTVSAERDGYIADPAAKATTVKLEPGDSKSGLVLKLLRMGVVSGRVLDADGEPVMGASIQIQPATRKKGAVRPAFGTTTNDRGEYRAYNVSPGKYRIAVSYAPGIRHANINIQRAADLSGAAAEEAYAVTWYPGTLSAHDAIVQVDSGADLAGFDLQLRRMRAVRVRGTVTGVGGAPTSLIAISLHPAGREGQLSEAFVASMDGRFDLGGVLPGRYILSAEAPLTQKTLTARRVVEVGENGLDGIQLMLGESQKLSGRILIPEGRTLPALMIVLSSREKLDQQGGGMAQPGSDGAFTMASVPPGDYDVQLAATGSGDDLYVAGIRMGDSDVLSDGVHVGGAVLGELEITLNGNGGALECSVSGSNQEPLPDAQVVVLPDPPRRSQLALYGDCRTDATGACTITGVAPGNYHVFAWPPSDEERDYRDPERLAELEKLGKAIKVAEGDRHKLALQAVAEQ